MLPLSCCCLLGKSVVLSACRTCLNVVGWVPSNGSFSPCQICQTISHISKTELPELARISTRGRQPGGERALEFQASKFGDLS